MNLWCEAIARGAVAIASAAAGSRRTAQGCCLDRIGSRERAQSDGRRRRQFLRASGRRAETGIGVTGTNGKTTITYIVDSILRTAGFTTGRIGTTGYDTPQGFRAATNTTPESIDLQQMFSEVRDAGGTHAVLEVSSHSLVMDRTWGCHFDVAIFTNLTRDHLNFHKTFEEYFAAKKALFAGTGAGAPGTAVLNIDDPYGARLDGLAKRTLTYGISSAADLTAKKFALSFHGLEFTAQTPAGPVEVRSCAGRPHQRLQHSRRHRCRARPGNSRCEN
jgi:UDP-N-acetylmuramyl tripeptide synthase